MLDVKNLSVSFKNKGETVNIIKNISFKVENGEVLCIVGESGSGKSVTGFSIMRLLNEDSTIINGNINLEEVDILGLSESEMQGIRGNKISMVYQEPMTALNPLLTIGKQISEGLIVHKNYSREKAYNKVRGLLELVKMPSDPITLKKYPHELSGGQRQRVVIAMALSCEPELIIADEPTTALDVTVQREILDLFLEIKEKTGTSIIFITHDLGVVAEVANRVMVLYGGDVLETANVEEFFREPKHPYSKGLIKSRPMYAENRRLYSIKGMAINPKEDIKGCNFYNRCSEKSEVCKESIPMIDISGHRVKCTLYKQGEETWVKQ